MAAHPTFSGDILVRNSKLHFDSSCVYLETRVTTNPNSQRPKANRDTQSLGHVLRSGGVASDTFQQGTKLSDGESCCDATMSMYESLLPAQRAKVRARAAANQSRSVASSKLRACPRNTWPYPKPAQRFCLVAEHHRPPCNTQLASTLLERPGISWAGF